ncbi:MAG: hydroxymethylpyrimidine/phosphomethylpyrimidine kinase [Planctomycetota bacterium]|nr:hydroxymethylpyrimidine/phosphomethylpyrimidine kinase [Planctomycetota bacterium]
MGHFPYPVCVAIGTIDGVGSTGVLADIKVFMALSCYGAAAATSVITQRREAALCRVQVCMQTSAEQLRAQLETLASSLPIRAVKIGYIPEAHLIAVVEQWLRAQSRVPVVIDPIILTSQGVPLTNPAVIRGLCEQLLPLGTLATPNRLEAAMLAGMDECLDIADMEEAATRLRARYGCPILVTGGGIGGRHIDLLAALDGISHFESPTVPRSKIAGTGCAHSAAITACLAKGDSLREAILGAKAYVQGALRGAPTLPDGQGLLWHGFTVRDEALAEVSATDFGLPSSTHAAF